MLHRKRGFLIFRNRHEWLQSTPWTVVVRPSAFGVRDCATHEDAIKTCYQYASLLDPGLDEHMKVYRKLVELRKKLGHAA